MRRWLVVLVAALVVAALLAAPVAAKTLRIAFVPKLVGIPYFNAMEKGGKQAAKDLGVEFIYTGPTSDDPARQVEIIDNLITRGVDVIAVAPNDPGSIGPILEKAKSRGIVVMTSDTDAPNTVRQLFVNQALQDEIGYAVMDSLAKDMNYEGKFAIVSCGPTAWNLNTWILYEQQRLSKYPKMELVTIRYAGEDIQRAVEVGLDLMTAFPDLKGLIGQCSTSGPGVAEAVTQAGKIGQVVATGVSVPSLMRPYVKNGAVKHFVLWDPVKLGYLTVWAGKQLAEGKKLQPEMDVPNVGKVKYLADQKMLVLGPPTVFDIHNVDNYDF
ncbi:MAG: autoinducer 2 ABC transporter substrate-binding protein [Limnochordaceae bacterium]|nr:autoinducer 2 ABC transporter substrate-binding protein [Limnochordaceae bacterium]